MLTAIHQDSPNGDRTATIRHNWTVEEITVLFELPFNDLIHQAHSVHREFSDPNEIQLSTLLNIKSGRCPEDCAYCPQSARFETKVEDTPLMQLEDVRKAAEAARDRGATRFCMGAAWRSPKEKDFSRVLEMVKAVNELGLESCATLGMLTSEQAARLREAGLAYYNHNLDTSPEFYKTIISTRDYDDRLQTLQHVRDAGMNVCCGGIIGMGEGLTDRAELLSILANMEKHPESVPINMLVRVEGTPLEDAETISFLEIIKTIAVARILMPTSSLRLSAGRNEMSEAEQALCFYVGANSVFFGERLLTTDNPQQEKDLGLFSRLGLKFRS
ncbi:MAG: biotin synthase BioB [Gammaproteobacteria bacterium]